MVYSNKYKFRKLRGTVQDSINEERARQNEDFNRKLKNAEDSMKAIYPEEYQKIRSRYFGNGNNLGLIGSQYNYIHDMITRRSDDQMKKYYNELNDYFIKQTGTQPGYMLPDVDVNEEYDPQGKIRDLTAVAPNSDYLNTVSANNAKQSVYNSDASAFNTGYEERLRDENPTAYDTWERAQNSPIVTAMEFSPLFPVVAGVKAVAAANAPQASGVDVGMNAAFAALPEVGVVGKTIKTTKKIPEITLDNYKTISDELFDKAYFKAINENNLEKTQRLRDLHFLKNAPDTKIIDEYGYPLPLIHRTPFYFNEFRVPRKTSNAGSGIFLADKVTLDGGLLSSYSFNNKNALHDYKLYVNITKPDLFRDNANDITSVFDGGFSYYPTNELTLSDLGEERFLSKPAKDILTDYKKQNYMAAAVAKKANQIKSADAITYDDVGNIIPLSKRDNFNSNDKRYILTTLGTTGLGLGLGYKFLNNQQKQTGDERVYDNDEQQYYKSGGIHINPKNDGKFTESANRAGMGVQEFARHVLANKDNYSSTTIKRANFARNASKWSK